MPLWLASYPRSGNTLLRQVLRAGWSVQTTSLYPQDLGNNKALEKACGHFELQRTRLPDGGISLAIADNAIVKTHELPGNEEHVIYVLRDGRPACVSLWHFYDKQIPMADVVLGRHRFGLWAQHIGAWLGSRRPMAVFKYEDIAAKSAGVVDELATIMGPPTGDPLSAIGARDTVAEKDGRWVRKKSEWQDDWSPEIDKLFWSVNGDVMRHYYPSAKPLA